MENWPETIGEARALAEEVPFVATEAAQLPELTGDLLIDSFQQSGFSIHDIELLSHRLDQRIEVTCDQLLRIAAALGGGLDPKGKRIWIESRLSGDFSFYEVLGFAEAIKDSPAT
jgi:hypothetical protein